VSIFSTRPFTVTNPVSFGWIVSATIPRILREVISPTSLALATGIAVPLSPAIYAPFIYTTSPIKRAPASVLNAKDTSLCPIARLTFPPPNPNSKVLFVLSHCNLASA
jgi:hypothetical protein